MADGIKGPGFTEVTSPNDADAIYLQTSTNTDGYVTAANFGAYFGSALYTVETATDNKTITSTATNYMLVFTRQATAKTITLPDAGTTGRTIKIVVIGSGVGNVTLANGDAATVGGFSVGDWEWDGTGNLTIIDDGSNWQVSESGIWDTYDVTYNSIDYPQDKYTNGKIVRRGYILGSYTANDIYVLFNTIIPTVGEIVKVDTYIASTIERTNSTTMTVRYLDGTPSVRAETATSTGGTLATAAKIGIWETKNTKWSV